MPKFHVRNNENWLMFAQRRKVIPKAENVLTGILKEETAPTAINLEPDAVLEEELETYEDRVDKEIEFTVPMPQKQRYRILHDASRRINLMWEKLEDSHSDTTRLETLGDSCGIIPMQRNFLARKRR